MLASVMPSWVAAIERLMFLRALWMERAPFDALRDHLFDAGLADGDERELGRHEQAVESHQSRYSHEAEEIEHSKTGIDSVREQILVP